MGILSDAEADPIKLALEVALPDRCAILRKGSPSVSATTGGWTEGESTYASNIPCRVDKSGLTPREQEIAGRRASAQAVRVVLSVHPSRWPGGVPNTAASDRLSVTGDALGIYEAAEDGGPTTDELTREIVCWKVS